MRVLISLCIDSSSSKVCIAVSYTQECLCRYESTSVQAKCVSNNAHRVSESKPSIRLPLLFYTPLLNQTVHSVRVYYRLRFQVYDQLSHIDLSHVKPTKALTPCSHTCQPQTRVLVEQT